MDAPAWSLVSCSGDVADDARHACRTALSFLELHYGRLGTSVARNSRVTVQLDQQLLGRIRGQSLGAACCRECLRAHVDSISTTARCRRALKGGCSSYASGLCLACLSHCAPSPVPAHCVAVLLSLSLCSDDDVAPDREASPGRRGCRR